MNSQLGRAQLAVSFLQHHERPWAFPGWDQQWPKGAAAPGAESSWDVRARAGNLPWGQSPGAARTQSGIQRVSSFCRDGEIVAEKKYLNIIRLVELNKRGINAMDISGLQRALLGRKEHSTSGGTETRLQFAEFSAFPAHLLPPSPASKPSRAPLSQPQE